MPIRMALSRDFDSFILYVFKMKREMIDDCPSDSFPLHIGSGILIVYQNALIFKRRRRIKVTGAAYDLLEKQG